MKFFIEFEEKPKKIYSYSSKHDKIFVAISTYFVYLYLGDKRGMRVSASSINESELNEDILCICEYANSRSARRWLKGLYGELLTAIKKYSK